jgi:mRNA-degrading endonuclease RelE of RelBE toxin-antitoxin system
MEFRIADTFTDSLLRLTAQEQKAVKTTAFDLQLNPAAPGMKFHKIDRARDPNFWSVRVNADIRLIVHKSAASLLLVYVDHHDDAYKWAERRKIVMACDDGMLPLEERIEAVSDESDLDEVYNTERHLLSVACTRARDCLLITGVAPASEFLADLTVGTAELGAGHEASGMTSARNAAEGAS